MIGNRMPVRPGPLFCPRMTVRLVIDVSTVDIVQASVGELVGLEAGDELMACAYRDDSRFVALVALLV